MKFAKIFDLPEEKQVVLLMEHPNDYDTNYHLTQLYKQDNGVITASTLAAATEEEINKEFDSYSEKDALLFLNEYIKLYNEQNKINNQ